MILAQVGQILAGGMILPTPSDCGWSKKPRIDRVND